MLATPLLLAYGTALTGTSFAFWANVGARRWGAQPMVLGDLPLKSKLSPNQKVSLWATFYDTAKNDMLPNFIPVMPALITIAYKSLPGSIHRTLGIVSTVAFGLVLPWTVFGIMPTNHQLLKIDSTQDEQAATNKAPALLRSFKKLNDIRMVLFFTSWSTLVASVLMRMA